MKLVTSTLCILAAGMIAVASIAGIDPGFGQHDGSVHMEFEQDEEIDSILEGCSGIALLEVKEFQEVDTRGSCGSLDLIVKFEAVKSHGTVTNEISILLEKNGGGHPGPVGEAPEPIISPDEIIVGKRFWIVFDWQSHWSTPVKALPADAVDFDSIEQKADALADSGHFDWRRTYNADANVCLEYKTLDADDQQDGSVGAWILRVTRSGTVLWEKRYSFPISEFYGAPLFQSLNFDTESSTGLLVHGQTAVMLDEQNEWGLEAGQYLLKEAFEVESGIRRESEVLIYQGGHAPIIQRSYDRPGRTILEIAHVFKDGVLYKTETRTGSGGGIESRRRFQSRTSQWEEIELDESDRLKRPPCLNQ